MENKCYIILNMSKEVLIMYSALENENYRKYGIVILEVYDATLRTTVYHYHKPTPSERK